MPAKQFSHQEILQGHRVLTLAELSQQNQYFRGSGGISAENRALGFRPAFYDLETGQIYPSRFADGREAPMHMLDGLPASLVLSRSENGHVSAARAGIIAGFMLNQQFYTREQAAYATRQVRDRAGRLSHPEHHNHLLDVWEHFVANEQYSDDRIRPVVEQSWSRCHRLRVDPMIECAPVTDAEPLALQRIANAELLHAGRPVLRRAYELLFRTDSLILLSDANGLILDLEADARVLNQARQVNLIEGANWAETVVGTNAIGTALIAGEPVQLYGAEHFCSGIKHWTCSAEVIRDPHDATVVGAVDLSGLTDAYQHDSLEFVITAARLIEVNLTRLYFSARQRVIEASSGAFQRWQNDGLLAFDHRGRLVLASRHAHRALADAGIDFALTPQSRLPALDLEQPTQRESIQDWWHSMPCHRLRRDGRVIGSLLLISPAP